MTPLVEAGASLGQLQLALPLDPLENRILLCHALGVSRVSLTTQSERTLTQDEAARIGALVQRRLDGEPIAYIVGEREFFGLPFRVGPGVLIPRPDTELIVELSLERLPPREHVQMVLVAAHAASDHAQQLMLQARHLRRDVGELIERHLAHIGGRQRDRIAPMPLVPERIQPDQLAGKMEPDHAFLAVFADRNRLERTIARDIHRRQVVARAEQRFAARDRPAPPHDRIELLQPLHADPRRQAQLLQ